MDFIIRSIKNCIVLNRHDIVNFKFLKVKSFVINIA